MKPTPYLFVYGTLKKGSHVPERRPLDDKAHYLNEVVLRAKLFHLDQYPGAVLSDDEADLVHGELYELKEVEATLQELDAYEGADFKRQLVDIRFPEFGFPLECWAYVYQGPVEGLTPVPGGRFLV
jgi:gamma-glutamylcyclotransferase (GGCT)/AIG2-like uncharacterized protein YtfP